MTTTTAFERLRAADPLADGALAPEEWREALFAQIAAEPEPLRRARRGRRGRLVLVAAALVALLAIPSYGVARDVIAWVRGEPAPQAVVDDFASYAPQLGYRPDASGAILVAVDEGDVRLYSTKNDRGSYCLVLTAPGRPRGDGGTCIRPQWTAKPLIAGTIGAIAGDDDGWTTFVVGRSTAPDASAIRFAGAQGEPITRPIGFDGFFVAEVRVPRAACGAGDWRPTFVVLDTAGAELARADITLLFNGGLEGVCGFSPPHPPHVR